MQINDPMVLEMLSTVVGIFIGTLAAFAVEKYKENQTKKKRAAIILRSILMELSSDFQLLKDALSEYLNTPWGKSFYISTTAWDTAVSSGDLPDIIGFELADALSVQYGHMVKIRYYVDLTTRLWFAPPNIPGYEAKRKGFNENIIDTINLAVRNHHNILRLIQKEIPVK